MSVLVTYGSKRGGTEQLAAWVAEGLRQEGFEVHLMAPREVNDLTDYDTVVVGGALYAFRWHRAARRFVKHHAAALRPRRVYFFSSGPLDDSAGQAEIPPVKGVRVLMDRVGAAGHITFGGRLSADARGFPARAMAKTSAGDWRDADQVRTWVRSIAQDMRPGLTRAA